MIKMSRSDLSGELSAEKKLRKISRGITPLHTQRLGSKSAVILGE
jgi:hypothetical protein